MASVTYEIFFNLGVALAIGLLIGVERGWKERGAAEGHRVAGVRTYGLIGLLGGVTALLSSRLGGWLLGLAFVAMAGVLVATYIANLSRNRDAGITSLIAGLLTFVFGALAAIGEVATAAAFAVIMTLLLGFKPLLHDWVSRIEGRELRAALKLLLITVVLLPVLPDQGYGPWAALNPYRIWWMVALIAAISFAGYVAIKIAGAKKGIVYTGLFAGLASSTALTLYFSRMARDRPAMIPLLSIGILIASGTMFPRILVLAVLLNPQLFNFLVLPVVLMTLIVLATVLVLLPWRGRHMHEAADISLFNPLDLKWAFGFGILLALIMLLGEALKAWLGTGGVLMLAAASGIADVDAITLSLSTMSANDLLPRIAVSGMVIAAVVNSLVKGVMATVIGGTELGKRVGLPLLAASITGIASIYLF